MTESFRGRITEFRRKYIVREEEETLDQARYSQEVTINRLEKRFLTYSPRLREKFLDAVAEGRSLNSIDWTGERVIFQEAAVRDVETLLAVDNQGLLVTTNVVLFDRLHLPVSGRQTAIPYDTEVMITCSPYPLDTPQSQEEILEFPLQDSEYGFAAD